MVRNERARARHRRPWPLLPRSPCRAALPRQAGGSAAGALRPGRGGPGAGGARGAARRARAGRAARRGRGLPRRPRAGPARGALTAQLGFDPLDPSALEGAGIEPWGGVAIAAYAFPGRPGSAPATLLVLPVRDAAKLDELFARVARDRLGAAARRPRRAAPRDLDLRRRAGRSAGPGLRGGRADRAPRRGPAGGGGRRRRRGAAGRGEPRRDGGLEGRPARPRGPVRGDPVRAARLAPPRRAVGPEGWPRRRDLGQRRGRPGRGRDPARRSRALVPRPVRGRRGRPARRAARPARAARGALRRRLHRPGEEARPVAARPREGAPRGARGEIRSATSSTSSRRAAPRRCRSRRTSTSRPSPRTRSARTRSSWRASRRCSR